MPNSDNTVGDVQVGDRVAYRLSTDEHAHGARGKVMGIFTTQDRQTLADVQWDTLGPPRRLNISNLTKI